MTARPAPAARTRTASGTMPVRVRRYCTPWEPDPRTPEQASDDAVAQLRDRLTGQEEP